jgi:surfactin synthase thioesterase subunit
MGTVVAYETALKIEPSLLFVSGCPPPSAHAARTPVTWDDSAILGDLKRLGGPNTALLENPALCSLALPALRADYCLLENYRPESTAKLRCPVVAFRGNGDQEVTADAMSEWSAVTDGVFDLQVVAGDHFSAMSQPEEIAGRVVSALRAIRRPGALRSAGT